MQAIVAKIHPHSPADLAGLLPGDTILAINDNADMEDMFDYQFELSDTEYVQISLKDVNGQEKIVEIEKDSEEDLGIVFTSPLFTPIRTCNNACDFCFIDQQPAGLRSSLYVKDDDYRLSYFTNTYITLTNLTPRDRERIERLRPGPLYISVHSTLPEVRVKALKNARGGNIMNELRWLKRFEIPFHAQIVVCPGLTDGESLRQSLVDLESLRPEALSVAVVPVGLTQYREALPNLIPVDAHHATDVIAVVDCFKQGYPNARDFVFLSDEFYFKANLPLPNYADYGDFPQLDDGVGTARMLLKTFFDLEDTLPAEMPKDTRVLLLTGKLGAMILQPIVNRLNAVSGLFVDLVSVQSAFWGTSVDVAGLVTGSDIIETLSAIDVSSYRSAIIPGVMLKEGTDQFLDDKTVTEIATQVGLPVQVVYDTYNAQAFLTVLFHDPILS